jgi:hypothetical protein
MSLPSRSRRALAPEAEIPTVSVPAESAAPDAWLAVVAEKVKGLHFGVVQIVVHDSKVVQIERTERTRFEVPQPIPNR